jgi:poly(hydroxyalkanoate) depolymerase family esterase
VFAALLGAIASLLAAMSLSAPTASAAQLTEVTDFGENPSNLRMHVYVPDSVTDNPAVLLAVHYCGGSGEAFYAGTEFASLADQYGFIVIYPTVTRSSKCFDVWSPEALTRDGGSDPVGLKSMVDHTLTTYNGDAGRVFVAGASSGAMMTNVMAANYPDVFAAGAAFSGVPYTCFATGSSTNEWNSTCSGGQDLRSPQEWGELVRANNPGYTGPWPRMQLWHGALDDTLAYPNFQEEIDQWTNVHGVGQTPVSTDEPQPDWTRTRYGDAGDQAPVEGISIANLGHDLPRSGMAADVIHFFGLDG